MVLGVRMQVEMRTDESIRPFPNVYTKAKYSLNHFIQFCQTIQTFQLIVNMHILDLAVFLSHLLIGVSSDWLLHPLLWFDFRGKSWNPHHCKQGFPLVPPVSYLLCYIKHSDHWDATCISSFQNSLFYLLICHCWCQH